MKRVYTKGNVEVQNIKVGDIHYEFEYGMGIQVEVVTKPVRDGDGLWTWKSKSSRTGNEVLYAVNENNPQYAPNLYDYIAYEVKTWI